MNSTPTPKAAEPHDALTVSADERLANAYEQIARADEELTRVSEQVAKMERDATRPPSDGPRPQSPPGRPQRRALVGLLLAACIVVAALALQSSYGAGGKLAVARWAPQLVATPSLPPENPPVPAQPAPSPVQVAAAEAAPPQAMPIAQTVAQTAPPAAPQGAAPAAAAALPDASQLRRKNGNDLANVERAHLATTQGEPTTNSQQRQFKSHCGAQGEPGRNKTRAREGFRAEPAQDVTTSGAARSGLAQARADVSVAARASAASNPKGLVLR